jgi:hypothetical protein
MSSYQKKRRELNFQARAKAYENALKFLATFETPRPNALYLVNRERYYNLRHPNERMVYILPNRFREVIPSLSKESYQMYITKNNAKRNLAKYKRNLNANANLYKTAGSTVRYSPQSRRYVQNHPGMKKQLAMLLERVRQAPQRRAKISEAVKSAFKYARNYKEAQKRFNTMKINN